MGCLNLTVKLGKRHVLSLAFLIMGAFCSEKAYAQAYTQLDWNINVILSDSEFNNGSSGGSPGVGLGYRFGRWAFEGQFIAAQTDQEHTQNGQRFDVDIRSYVFGVGADYHFARFASFQFGLHFQDVKGEYANKTTGESLVSTIDGAKNGFYLGTRFVIPFSERFDFYSGFAYYLDDADYSLFGFNFGLRYYFGSAN